MALFSCVATGDPAPKIVWFRGSTAIPTDGDRYEVMDNGTLMIHNTDETDVGFIECMAKNAAGEARSKPAKIMLETKDSLTGKIQYFKFSFV